MFDIGFWELAIIALVALVVIGPERLPAVARTAGSWFARLRRVANEFRQEVSDELRAEELRQALAREASAIREPLEQATEALNADLRDMVDSADQARRSVNSETIAVTRERAASGQQDGATAKIPEAVVGESVTAADGQRIEKQPQ